MAQTIICGNEHDEGQVAIIMVTNLGNGDTEAYCWPCWLQFCAVMAREAAAPAGANGSAGEPGQAPATAPHDPADDDDDEDRDDRGGFSSATVERAMTEAVQGEATRPKPRARRAGAQPAKRAGAK